MNANENAPRAASLRKRAIAVVVIIAIALIAIMLLMFNCTSAAPAGDADAADTSHVTQSNDETGSSRIVRDDTMPEPGTEIEEGTPSSDAATEQADGTLDLLQGTETPDSAPQVPASGRTASSSNPAPAQSQKKWVEDTERIWVVDKDAWTEEVPVYGTVEVSICNICGTDITGNTSAHAKEHMKAGEGSGHHSEVRQIVSGYDTISHPAEGHWETKVVGGHWEQRQ